MSTALPNSLEFRPPTHEAKSLFECLPEICYQHGYALRRLTESSASFSVAKNVFRLHPHTIIADTAFRFERHTPEALGGLVAKRNASLRAMGWMHQGHLALIVPLIRKEIDRNWLDATITAMVVEITQFSRKLRANGIWEF